MFRKLLVANRGEIAVRILRACREMDIRGVAVYSEVDRTSEHVLRAEEAYPIGPAPSSESYLRIDKLIQVARRSGAEALHPGYGFLAENPALARACSEAGVVFIGPTAEALERMGSKTEARKIAEAAGVPPVPGTHTPLSSLAEAGRRAAELGYPVLLKAVAGGGGKGMRRVGLPDELAGAWRDAQSEAQNAFGDSALYVEKCLERPRHVEIQVLGDGQGNLIHLGERECSLQRRHQKVVEESPSPILTPELRQAMGEAAVRIARAAGYTNAGTVEFLVVPRERGRGEGSSPGREGSYSFYFLEMNARLQVEHPVTELVTGIDLVKQQIRLAAGEPLRLRQEQISWRGAAIECRIYAEDPERNFLPCPGRITRLERPSGPGVRVDGYVYEGWQVPIEYDPLLAKLICWGETRAEAVARLARALDEYQVCGIETNLSLFRRLLQDPAFLRGELDTEQIDRMLKQKPAPSPSPLREAAAVAVAVSELGVTRNGKGTPPPPSRWKQAGREAALRGRERSPR